MNDAGDINEKAKALPEISIEILGPIANLKGYDWVSEKQDQPRRQILVDQPHNLVIHLPSGRVVRSVSKATFFKQEKGIVIDASLMPNVGSPIPYQDAINLLELTLRQWDAEPNELGKALIAEWKAEGNLAPWDIAQRRGSAILRGESKAGIYFEIRPGSTGWFPTITVGATLEEERRLWGSEAPATQPHTTK